MENTTKIEWDAYSACACVDQFDDIEHTEEEVISAWQYLIDTGLAWSLQGRIGRAAMSLIQDGVCHPAS